MWLTVYMYLRETSRKNKDGSTVTYLQLAHNERHPVSGVSTPKVIHSFGRAEQVDRAALARLVASISRILPPEEQAMGSPEVAQVAGGPEAVEVIDSRRLGGTWVLDRLWDRLGIGAAIRRAAAGRRLDAGAFERVCFALVANRALEPSSKLAATKWASERVVIEDLAGFSDDDAYRAMDFLLEALEEISEQIFSSVAHLLNLDVEIVFIDSPANPPEGALAVLPAMAFVPRSG